MNMDMRFYYYLFENESNDLKYKMKLIILLYKTKCGGQTEYFILCQLYQVPSFKFCPVCTKIYSTTIELAVICNLVSLVKLDSVTETSKMVDIYSDKLFGPII
ncbi:hypothetical protein BLOT_003039 [Blomia tropicalis]|nr:hypothetical protein BLOT_003039 [Blomia tropicalis]